jgi:hypothetical protein
MCSLCGVGVLKFGLGDVALCGASGPGLSLAGSRKRGNHPSKQRLRNERFADPDMGYPERKPEGNFLLEIHSQRPRLTRCWILTSIFC